MRRRLLLGASAILLLVSVAMAYLEIGQYLNSGPSARDQFLALQADKLAPGLSTGSASLLMNGCVLALTSVYGLTQPTTARQDVARTCAARAAAITVSTPSFSYGWYVEAMASDILNDAAAMNRALAMSQRTGATEQWLAEQRAALAEDNFDLLDHEAALAHENDLALLVRSDRGVATIAKRYVEQPAFRERITAIVETMADDSQRIFLDRVRAAASGK